VTREHIEARRFAPAIYRCVCGWAGERPRDMECPDCYAEVEQETDNIDGESYNGNG
jgi:hypothetical protein